MSVMLRYEFVFSKFWKDNAPTQEKSPFGYINSFEIANNHRYVQLGFNYKLGKHIVKGTNKHPLSELLNKPLIDIDEPSRSIRDLLQRIYNQTGITIKHTSMPIGNYWLTGKSLAIKEILDSVLKGTGYALTVDHEDKDNINISFYHGLPEEWGKLVTINLNHALVSDFLEALHKQTDCSLYYVSEKQAHFDLNVSNWTAYEVLYELWRMKAIVYEITPECIQIKDYPDLLDKKE
jgi:hypothetical protein